MFFSVIEKLNTHLFVRFNRNILLSELNYLILQPFIALWYITGITEMFKPSTNAGKLLFL